MALQKKRLDILLFERGLAKSREAAKALIMSGIVYVNGQKEDKPGTAFGDLPETIIEVRGNDLKYVSRGGLKLEKALKVFPIDLKSLVCLDIGASTGGFTDCMLMEGAKKVYAVDVGHGQLAWKLQNDPRVVNMEKTNIRYLTVGDIINAGKKTDDRLNRQHIQQAASDRDNAETDPKTGQTDDDNELPVSEGFFDFASCDVSFISLDKVLPVAVRFLKDEAKMVCLIKPQFEAGREEVGKKGVVRDSRVHEKVIIKVAKIAKESGFEVSGLDFSPIKGPEGNIEYLIYLNKLPSEHIAYIQQANVPDIIAEKASDTVKKAFSELGQSK